MTSRTRAREQSGARGPDPDDVEAAMKRAMGLLAVRSRSCSEVSSRLTRAGFSAEAAEAVVRRLLNVGLLDDEAFAAEVVRWGMASGKSSRAARHDLTRWGVAPEIADQSLSEVEEPGADEERALLLAERRVASCRNLPLEKAVPRVVRHLCSKGYAPSLAWEAARQAFRDFEIDID